MSGRADSEEKEGGSRLPSSYSVHPSEPVPYGFGVRIQPADRGT